VRFLGFVDPDEVYRSIDLLVVPSLWEEPLGMIVPEAFMHGVPAVVAGRGGLTEMVEEGRTGIVYEPLEPLGLRQAVDVFLRDRRILDQMRPLVLERAKYFLQGRMQAEYLDLMAAATRLSASGNLARKPAGDCRSMLVQDDAGDP